MPLQLKKKLFTNQKYRAFVSSEGDLGKEGMKNAQQGSKARSEERRVG